MGGEHSALAVLCLLYPREGDLVAQKSGILRTNKKIRALSALQECLRTSGCPWVCVDFQDANVQVQFMPARNVAGTESDLSSTKVRTVVRNVESARRVLALTDLVSNSQLLSDLVDEHKKKQTWKDIKQSN
jgi:hypothetical protein